MEPTQPKSLFLAAFLRKGAFGRLGQSKTITTEDTEDTEEKHCFASFARLSLRPLRFKILGAKAKSFTAKGAKECQIF
jgi:hypothetical protein